MLQITKEVFKHSTNCIPITFCENMSKIAETKGYQITNVRVSLFQAQRILKTTETTGITEDDNCKTNVTEKESSISSLKKHKRNNSFTQYETL